MKKKMVIAMLLTMSILTACGGVASNTTDSNSIVQTSSSVKADTEDKSDSSSEDINDNSDNTNDSEKTSENEIFTDRDLEQNPDLSSATKLSLEDGKDISITEEGIYLISGSASNVTITVDADDNAKVQLVLDGATITNDSAPCIYVKSVDKVFVTTTDSENVLKVTGSFTKDGDTKTDAVIFSKDDLVLNGTGKLTITSSDNGVTTKDELKITGGTINIECSGNAFEAHDAINVADGTINVLSCNDGLHSDDSDDDSIGSIYIAGGTFNINATDDAIHATTTVTVDGGDITLSGREGIEGTYIKVNDGNINITASDDGINAGAKSSKYTATYEMNGGTVKISMGQGDTDGVDSNGNIYINGGTIDITGQSTFDYDGEAKYSGGTIIENGTETNTITNQMMGGHGGGPGGDKNGMNREGNAGGRGNMGGEGNMHGKMGGHRMGDQQAG